MAKKKIRLGILVIILVFGMTVVGCDSNSTNEKGGLSGLNTETPSSSVLNNAGITLAQFNQIKNFFNGFQGWIIEDGEEFVMIWSGRTKADEVNIGNFIMNLGITNFEPCCFLDEDLPYSINSYKFTVGTLGVWFGNW